MARADEIGALIEQSFPGARVTSTVRTRAEQDALIARGATKARNSQHLTGNGLDVVLPRGVSPAQVRSFLSDRGITPGEFLNESGGRGQGTGAHLHIGLAPRASRPAPAKGGGQQSAGGGTAFERAQASRQRATGPSMASVYQAYRNTGKAGGMTPQEAAQFETAVLDGHVMLPRGASLRVKPAAPVLPKAVVEAYNSHRMDDDPDARAELKRALDAGEVSLPRGMRLQAPAPRSFGEKAGMYARSAAEGIAAIPDTLAYLGGLVTGSHSRPLAGLGVDAVADAAGAATPESDTEKLIGAVVGGGAQGLVTGPIGAARGVLARTALDVASGGAAGGASETARQAGAGPVGQVVAGLAGGALPIGSAAAVSRIRAPKSLPEVVESVPRAAVVDEAGNLTPEGQEIAARHGVSPEEVRAAYEAPPRVKDATANDQLPQATARTAGEPVEGPAPIQDAEVPPVSRAEPSELPPQPNAPNADQPSPGAPEALPATALARVQQAQEFGVDMSRGQATKSFDIQDAESRLRNSNGPEAEQMRQFVSRQAEQVKTAADEFRSAFGDTAMTAEQRGTVVQEAIRELRDNGQKGVTALYKELRELGQEVPLESAGIRQVYDRLMVEANVPDSAKAELTQEMARYGLIGETAEIAPGKVTAENGITTVKLDNGQQVKFYGEPQTLRLDNAEDLRKAVSALYSTDGPRKLTSLLKSAIDDASEQAAEKLAQYDQTGSKVPAAAKSAREAHVEQVKTFKAKDIVQSIADWKKGTNTDVLKPEQVMQQALAKTSDLKRVKAVLLTKPTVQSKAAWRAIQAHGLAEVFAKATTRNTNVAGEITEAISGAKLRSAIESFGSDKLKVLLDPDDFNKLMKLRRVIEDVTIPITGTTNPSGSGNLLMRLARDVDNQVTAAFAALGTAVAGPGVGTAIGGAAGRTIGPVVKDIKQARANAETLKGVTEYTPEIAASDTGAPKPSAASKAGSAVKDAGAKTIKAFIDTYSSPRILAPVLASTTGAQEQ